MSDEPAHKTASRIVQAINQSMDVINQHAQHNFSLPAEDEINDHHLELLSYYARLLRRAAYQIEMDARYFNQALNTINETNQ